MLTFLDLLVIVFMVLMASSLLALCLMFLVRNPRIKKVCFYLVAALGIYSASVGIRIGWPLFPGQVVFGIIAGVAAAAALVIVLAKRDSEKAFRSGRILAAAALVVGIVNAIL